MADRGDCPHSRCDERIPVFGEGSSQDEDIDWEQLQDELQLSHQVGLLIEPIVYCVLGPRLDESK